MTGQGELLVTEPYTREEFPTKDAWLKGRRHGIGASEASAVLGLNPWKSALQLYAEKLEIAEPDAAESEAMEWGLLLEPVIAERYAGVTRRQLAPVEPMTIYRSRRHPFMTATFDRLIIGDPRGLGVLQIKTAGAFKAEDWEDEPPVYYQVQTQQEMAIAGATWGSLAVLIGGQRFRYFDLARNDRFLSVLVEREEAFWNRLLSQDPPEVDGSESARDILRKFYPKETPGLVVNLPGDVIEWDAELQQIKAGLKGGESRKQELENKIRAAIGEAETGICSNGLTYTWKASERAGYTVQPTMTRTLRRKDAK
jgi:putative phage-type endonuclease